MNESDGLEGHWQIVTAELAGETMPDLVAHKIEVELARGTYTVRFGGEIADQGTFTLTPHPTTKALTLTGIAGTNAGRTIPAIYRYEDEHLHICYGLDGVAPTVFASQLGSAHFFATYRRKT